MNCQLSILTLFLFQGAPALLSKTESITALTNDDVYDAFEKELLSKGVKEDFAQQVRANSILSSALLSFNFIGIIYHK